MIVASTQEIEAFASTHGFTIKFDLPWSHDGHTSDQCSDRCIFSWRATISDWTEGGERYYTGPDKEYVAQRNYAHMKMAVEGKIPR
jgi:hypothetical protein